MDMGSLAGETGYFVDRVRRVVGCTVSKAVGCSCISPPGRQFDLSMYPVQLDIMQNDRRSLTSAESDLFLRKVKDFIVAHYVKFAIKLLIFW